MSISEKLTAIANNVQKVYEAGKAVSIKNYSDEFWTNFTNRKDGGYMFYNMPEKAFYPSVNI